MHIDVHVNAVEQGAAKAAEVAGDLQFAAVAGLERAAHMPAGAFLRCHSVVWYQTIVVHVLHSCLVFHSVYVDWVEVL